MKATPSTKKNFVYSTLYQILTVITPLITAPYLSRKLEASGTGIQSFTASMQSYFLLFAVLGTATYGAREISRNRNNKKEYSKLFWEIELMTVLTSAICVVLWLIWCVFAKEYNLIYLVMTWNLFAVMFDISWFFTGLEQFKFIVIRNSFFKLLGIVLMFIIVKTKSDLTTYILMLALTNFASALSMWTYLPKFLVKISLKELCIKQHFTQTLIYFVPTIATSIYTVLDKTLLQFITHDELQNGYYAQAEKVINLSKSIVFTAINSVVGVRISYLFVENKIEEIKNRIENSFQYIFFVGFACVFGIIAVASNFVPLFFGKGYDQVVPLLYIFSPIILIIGVSNCLGSHYYTPSGRRAQSSRYLICGSVVNLFLNFILIPFWSAYGAAIASIIAELTITILYMKNCNKIITYRKLFDIAWKKIIAGVAMFIITWKVQHYLNFKPLFELLLQIMIAIVVYFGILLIMRDKWLLGILQSILKKYVKRRMED